MTVTSKKAAGGGIASYALPRGRQPSIEWVPLGELRIDDSYQRSIETDASRKLIRAIAAEWDWDVFDVLKVSRRPDNSLFVIDGQHRRAAAELRGDITQLPCVLKRCAGPAEEARIFIASNRGRKRMSRIDDFRAALGAGDADALAIARLVDAAGLKIARHEQPAHVAPGELMIVGSLRTLFIKHGERALGQALTLIGEAFPDEVLVQPAAMLGAILALLAHERPAIDPDRLFQTLLTGTTQQWSDWANLRMLSGTQSKILALRALVRQRYSTLAVAA